MSTSSPLELRYSLTLPEFMAAANAHWRRRGAGTVSCVVTAVLACLVGLLARTVVPTLSVVILVMGLVLLLITVVRSYTWRKAYREARKYTDSIRLVVSDDGIHVESAEGVSDLRWTFYSKYLVTPDYILLYMTSHAFSVIPMSAFADEADASRFRQLVENHLEPVGRKKSA
jgi:hypothetical protein